MRKIMVCCAALAACSAGGTAALAATATASSKGTLTIGTGTECSIKGANINLGTYKPTDTFQTVANHLGYKSYGLDDIVQGAIPVGGVNMGSVTCLNGIQYIIEMTGTGPYSEINLKLPGGMIYMVPMISRIGNNPRTCNGFVPVTYLIMPPWLRRRAG